MVRGSLKDKEATVAEIRAFRGIRFDAGRLAGDLSSVIAPPYDVLDQSDKDALLRRNPRNIVAIDLPHLPPKSAGPPKVYEDAARTLTAWRSEGVLTQDAEPSLYIYHQTFSHDGRNYVRPMFIAAVRLRAFDEGVILPHEKTFGGPKEDRLALMKATGCTLSPIFGLYADPNNDTGKLFAATIAKPADCAGTLDGVNNQLWRVTDRGTIGAAARILSDRRVYIADGHHRYGTALMYREWAKERSGGKLPDDHPANFVMFVLASMDDPGCLIMPYFRALGGISLDQLLSAWSDGVRAVSDRQQADLVLHEGASGREAAVAFTHREALDTLAPDECPAWRKLDYAYLHRYLIDELLAKRSGVTPAIHYLKSREMAVQSAKDDNGVALLVKATPMAHLRAVAEAGGLMPQKSTYFHPKLATGMTILSLQ